LWISFIYRLSGGGEMIKYVEKYAGELQETMLEDGCDNYDICKFVIEAYEKDLIAEENELVVNLVKKAIRTQPLEVLAPLALLKLAELGINANAKEVKLTNEATFNDNRYKCKMIITWEEVK
jgi:hypothetical protein